MDLQTHYTFARSTTSLTNILISLSPIGFTTPYILTGAHYSLLVSNKHTDLGDPQAQGL